MAAGVRLSHSYRAYYLRPKPILRIIKTMLEDKDVFVRRCREGYEFFKSLRIGVGTAPSPPIGSTGADLNWG